MAGTRRPKGDFSTGLLRIAEGSRLAPEKVWTALAHRIDIDLLKEAYRLTRKDGAVGVDGQTAEEYAARLEDNLQSLLNRFKSGSYRAPPVRRVHIPKGRGKPLRPIGIPTFEDKVLQRAVKMVLDAVYEQDFLDCSFGFRPNRSAHQALQAIWEGTMKMRGGWVLDVDIEDFFGSLGHAHLRDFLDTRVRDGVLRHVLGKWMKAGVLEHGQLWRPTSGTPQGGVISPLLANIYLHHVLDRWFAEVVTAHLRARAFLVRFADDFVIVCELERDAQRVMEALGARLERYGLKLHPTKTRMVDFRQPRLHPGPDEPKPGTFDFLGFTHHWGRTRKGGWAVKRKTAKDRFRRAAKRLNDTCRRIRHLPKREQQQILTRKLRGHDAYYGITANSRALQRLRFWVARSWHKWLNRRNRERGMTWDKFNEHLRRFPLPPPRVVHSFQRGTQ